MRAFVIQIPPVMINSPTRMIITSIVSHRGICFEGFSVMVLRLLAPPHRGPERRRLKWGTSHPATRRRDWNPYPRTKAQVRQNACIRRPRRADLLCRQMLASHRGQRRRLAREREAVRRVEPRFTCTRCGKKGADVRPKFSQAKMGVRS